MAERSHKSSSQHSHVQVQRKATHAKLLERNLKDLSLEELVAVADRVKTPAIAVLRLFVTAHDSHEVNDRFTLLDRKTTQACLHFSRALAQAIGRWLQQLELGLRLWNRELKLLAEALCCTKTLRRLSFANSGLGDIRFQILAKSIRECAPLHTLNLSGCGLTDLSVPYIVSIVKGSPKGERVKPEEEHTPGQLSPEQALACQSKLQKAQKTSQEWSSRQFPLQGKWAPASSMENGATSQKDVDWQASLRQSGTFHSTICIPSKETADGALGLRSLDLSYNQFTDDLADELCPVLYEEAPLSALHLQSNQLTREGAKTFEAVMKERRVLQLVDLRDNKQEVPTLAHSANIAATAAKSIPSPIYPNESSRTHQHATDSHLQRSALDKYRRSFLAKPKHVSKIHITGSTVQTYKPTGALADSRPVCVSPGVQVAINKLPLRPKSARERLHKPLVATPRSFRQMNPLNCFTSRRMDSESEFNSRIMLNTERSLRCKPSRDSKRQMTESSTSRPRSAPDRIRIPLCPPRKTPRGKAYFKNPRFGGSVPGSARSQSHGSVTDEIAPWEDGKSANASQHPHTTLTSKINAETKTSDTSAQEDKTSLPPGRKFKKRKSKSQNSQFPNSRHATYRTVTSLVPLLGNKNMQTCPEKQKRRPKVKPNVVKRMELLCQSGREAASVDVQEIPSTGEAEEVPTTTQLVSTEKKDPLSAPIATEKENSHEWNNFMSEMTKTLLNLNGTRLPVPHLAEVLQTRN